MAESQKASLLGGLIVGKVLDKVLDRAFDKVAKSPSLPVNKPDVPAIKDIVAREIEQEAASREVHQSNQEPWYQSRVTLGALGTILGGIGGMLTLFGSGEASGVTDYWPYIVAIGGAAMTLYGRWVAIKPLGQ